MKCLIILEGGAGAILPLVPLAHALRGAGHDLLVSAHAEHTSILLRAGVVAFGAPQKSPRDYLAIPNGRPVRLPNDLDERAAILGSIGAQIAADTYYELTDLAREWRPDLIVGGPLAYGAPLLSEKLGVPLVAVEFGMAEPYSWHDVTVTELARLGFTDLPQPILTLSLCPESVRPAPGTVAAETLRYLPAEPIQYVPFSPAVAIEPWMFAKGNRPRVWVTAGSRVSADYALDYLAGLIEAATALDVELLIATPGDIAAEVRAQAASVGAKVGWLPFDILAPTCDLAVHHGGGSTLLGAAANALPQVIIPYMPEAKVYSRPLGSYGAAEVLPVEENISARLLDVCEQVLAEQRYRLAAAELRNEMRAAPTPAAVVARLERLVGADHAGV